MDVFKTLILDTPTVEGATGTVTSVDLTAGTGISVSGGPITSSGSITVTNTSPDQTVALTGGTGISTSGTYPNFTITNDAPDQTVALTGGTGISTSGAYPNFTITNDAPDQTVSIAAGTGISTSGTYPSFTVTNSAPDQTVSIASGTGISVTGSYPSFTVTNSSPSLGGDVVGPASSTDNGIVRFDGTTGKLVQDSSSVVIDDSGNVGIGTTSPAHKLHVAGTAADIAATDSAVGTRIFSSNAASAGFVETSTNHPLILRTNQAERMRIDTSGNVGIGTKLTVGAGTIASDMVFHVQKGTALTQPTWNVNDVAVFANESGRNTVVNILSSNAVIGQLVFSDTDARAVAAVAYNHSNDTMSLNVNGGATVCAISSTGLAVTGAITATGNVGIGTTSISSTKLRVLGVDSTSSNWAIYAENGGPTIVLAVRNDGLFYTGTAAASPYNRTTGSAANLYVDTDGSLFRSTSSLRYKTDVATATHGLSDVLKLRSVTYKGKNDGEKVFGGLIAEEVHEAGLTEFVSYNPEGEPDAVEYGNMVALAFKAIQELKGDNDSLRRRLEALESK